MLTLAINTASSVTAIAIMSGGKLIKEDFWTSKNDEAEKLMPKIKELLGDHKFEEINKVIAISGPGSFTGLRVGVTVANTIAYINNCGLYEIDTFSYWWGKHKIAKTSCALLIYAGSGGVYVSTSQKEKPILVNLPELNAYLKDKSITEIFGDISTTQKEEIKGFKFTETLESFGTTMAKIESILTTPVKMIKPNYIKLPAISAGKNKIFG